MKKTKQDSGRLGTLSGLVVSWAAAGIVSGCGGDGAVSPQGEAPPVGRSLSALCEAFVASDLPHGAKQIKTELRAAQGTLPEVCIVRGQIVSSPASTINWAVELPAPETWNGKTITVGGGGFDGFIPTDDPGYQEMVGTSANPYVKISSDSGHQTPGFEWAVDDVALQNHAYDANHFALEVGTRIATIFYGKAPTRRYSFGHSNGGRAGLVAAQRYPKDYDGVIALAPAIAQEGFAANNAPLLFRHFFEKRENWMSPAKIALFAEAETKACDGLDGLEDGIIGNVDACSYIPTDLLCEGEDNDSCLTEGQIESIRRIYTDRSVPVALADGAVGYPRYGRGGAATGDWTGYMFGRSFDEPGGFNYFAATEIIKVVENNPAASILTHDPVGFVPQYQRLSSQIDATNPDLSAFADNGGKMLIWYGVGDGCVSIYRLARYLETVEARLGATKMRSFVRHLTSPSVGHNLAGPGAMHIDFVGILDAWVENGAAPDRATGTRFAEDGKTPEWSRPLCEYPKFPRYDGKGDPSKAESFACSAT